VRLAHHDLCFGCGPTNLFGPMLEVQRGEDGSVAGRCFIKQDHQGPDRVSAHDGVVAAALSEAMALACGPDARARAISVVLTGGVPVGTFLEVRAVVAETTDAVSSASAAASCEGREVASARGSYALAIRGSGG
jgi:acyl-coenzyme A thioesterase PaaI-like protein